MVESSATARVGKARLGEFSNILPSVATSLIGVLGGNMDLWVNPLTIEGQSPFNSPIRGPMRKISDVRFPQPERQFAFVDENPNSIFEPSFWVDGEGIIAFDSIPASYHNDGGVMSYMDGHVIAHKWLDPKTRMPLNPK